MNPEPPRLLLDQGLPRVTARLLRALGWDVVHTGEIGIATALDEEIIRRGRNEGRVVVTLDADFHAILALEGASSPSVMRLRVQGLGGAEIASLIQAVVGVCSNDLAKGAAVTADSARVKVRRLPLGR